MFAGKVAMAEVLGLGPKPRYGIIGGSGVQVEGKEQFRVSTPFGDCLISCLDDSKRVLFVNRHLCTTIDATGKATYAPPHLVNYQAMIWALAVECGCASGIVALGSTGTLHPETIPVGSVVMPDDYYMVRPEPVTFWPHPAIGDFAPPEENGLGRIHYSPADPQDAGFTGLRNRVQAILGPVLPTLPEGRVKFAERQTAENWPCVPDHTYVNTIGPRFETRAEIRQYRGTGHVVGMTCAREWALCEELRVPYALVCFCDNSCNGLSAHPGGALQEYLEHKQTIKEVTAAVVASLVAGLQV